MIKLYAFLVQFIEDRSREPEGGSQEPEYRVSGCALFQIW
jgi:hypothetical protein